MRSLPPFVLLVLLLLVGCKEVMEENTSSAHTELGMLPKLITLPKPPVSVKWVVREHPFDGGRVDDAQLTALLKFTPKDYQYIIEHSREYGATAETSMAERFLSQSVPMSDSSATSKKLRNREFDGFPPKEPNLFVVGIKSPYAKGKIYPLGDGYIIVSMSTL